MYFHIIPEPRQIRDNRKKFDSPIQTSYKLIGLKENERLLDKL